MTTEAGGTFRPGHGQPYPLHIEVGGFTPTEFLPGGDLCHSRYRAIATCCGREHLVTHRQLQQRERYGVERCGTCSRQAKAGTKPVSYTNLRAHETGRNLVCRLLLDKKKKNTQ